MRLSRALALIGLALFMLPLAGCAEAVKHLNTDISAIKTAVQTVADAKVPANVALIAANTFDGFETVATDILVDCTPGAATPLPASLCAAQRGNIAIMRAAVHAGRSIRDAIEPAPGQALPVSQSAYDKLEGFIGTITTAVNAFNAAKAGS